MMSHDHQLNIKWYRLIEPLSLYKMSEYGQYCICISRVIHGFLSKKNENIGTLMAATVTTVDIEERESKGTRALVDSVCFSREKGG